MTIAEQLSHALADTFTLALKTQNYHWNVTGEQFQQLHELFEEQYDDLYEAADDVAERMRALGVQAPGGLEAFAKLTKVREANSQLSAQEMIRDLAEEHRTLSKRLHGFRDQADEAGDPATVSILEDRMVTHDKFAWMLESHLAG